MTRHDSTKFYFSPTRTNNGNASPGVASCINSYAQSGNKNNGSSNTTNVRMWVRSDPRARERQKGGCRDAAGAGVGWNSTYNSEQVAALISHRGPKNPPFAPPPRSDTSRSEYVDPGSPGRRKTLDSSAMNEGLRDTLGPDPYKPQRATIRPLYQTEQAPERIPQRANSDRLFKGTVHELNNNSDLIKASIGNQIVARGSILPRHKNHRSRNSPRYSRTADHAQNNRSNGFISTLDGLSDKAQISGKKGTLNRWADSMYSTEIKYDDANKAFVNHVPFR